MFDPETAIICTWNTAQNTEAVHFYKIWVSLVKQLRLLLFQAHNRNLLPHRKQDLHWTLQKIENYTYGHGIGLCELPSRKRLFWLPLNLYLRTLTERDLWMETQVQLQYVYFPKSSHYDVCVGETHDSGMSLDWSLFSYKEISVQNLDWHWGEFPNIALASINLEDCTLFTIGVQLNLQPVYSWSVHVVPKWELAKWRVWSVKTSWL